MMHKLINEFPDNLEEGLKIARNAMLKPVAAEIHEIVICGMGGSGIGGKIVSLWLQDELKYPVILVQDYNLPNFVDENTLVIASSYSGDTEETLMSVEKAAEKGARIIAITSGGRLKDFCAERNFDYIIVPGGNPPRSAIAFSLIQLVAIFAKLGMVSETHLTSFENALKLIRKESDNIKSEARSLSTSLNGFIPIFYAGAKYEGIAVRARQQFNENAKTLCWHHVIPEMNHNELVGWGGGDERFAVVLFNTGDLIPRNQRRFEITMEVIRQKTPNVIVVDAMGESIIERSLYLIHLIDWASYFSAEQHKVDSMEIEVIDFLKNELSNFN